MNRQPILQTHSVSFSYNEKPVIDNVSFVLKRGHCAALIGPNGAGKTTLLRLLSHVLKPSHGEVLLKGKLIHNLSHRQLAREMAVVPQETVLGFPFSVREVVLMGRSPFTGTFGLETEDDYAMAEMAMKRLDILHLANRRFDSLSGGERQRTILARALTQKPKLLLLDEPATHLDISHQITIHELLLELANEGVTILSVTHDLALAAEFFPRVLVLKAGKIVADGDTEHVLTEDKLRAVYGVDTHVDRNPISGRPRIFIHREHLS